jgi:hypothetical protein
MSSDEDMSGSNTPQNIPLSTPQRSRGPKRPRGDQEVDSPSSYDLLLNLTKDTKDIKTNLAELNTKIDARDLEVQQLQLQSSSQQNQIKAHEKTIQKQSVKIDSLEKTVEELYLQLNKNNLIMKGIKAKNPQEAYTEICKLFKKCGGHDPQISIIRPLYKGSSKLMVKFEDVADRNLLLENAANLHRDGIALDYDIPPSQRETKNMLLRQRREILDNKVATTVKVYAKSLLLDGSDWYDLDKEKNIMIKRPSVNKPRPQLPPKNKL